MPLARNLRIWLVILITVAGLGAAIAYWFTRHDPGDPRLNAFVHNRPPVPIVFTSRSEPASMSFAAPEGEGFTSPGQRLWAAREGRLRLLTPRGTVHELTWGKQLPDGSTLIDVMSPSISLDGERVLFAGRKGGDDPGRFRLYEIGVDGSGLKQLTGGPDDEGCIALPPMRWRSDGSTIPDAERRATDYDDVDPIELNYEERRILFVSSRTPDLGRDHARRSSTLWIRQADGKKRPVTGNRNNDRWPFLLSSRYIAFSLWSRNREVVTSDLTDIRPFETRMSCATQPTDSWLGAFTQVPGGHFGMLTKPQLPVWRPRPLFVNRISFMTTFAEAGSTGEYPPLTVVQAPPGMLTNSPSARSAEHPLPNSETVALRRGPERDAEGRPLWLATPSPCPTSNILLTAASITTQSNVPEPGAFGIYMAKDDWPADGQAATTAEIDFKLLFDDPEFVDAEPVAVYRRKFAMNDPAAEISNSPIPVAELSLANGHIYKGPMGRVLATAVDSPTAMGDLPGQKTDTGEGPIFTSAPAGEFDHLRIYAARRDRFDDPVKPRIPGGWELLVKIPIKSGSAAGLIPADSPTVLAGFDKTGHIVHWTTAAKDKQGRQATLYAYAGDHYSQSPPDGKTFCVGCHPGHSGVPTDTHKHAENLP